MSDLLKRGYSGATALLHADSELALKRVRDTVDANAAYTAADPDIWDGSPPPSLLEAIQRIAAVVASNHGGTIPEL